MIKPNLTQASTFEPIVIASLDVADIDKLKAQKYVRLSSKNSDVEIALTESEGSEDYLQLHIHLFGREDGNENLFIDQEVSVTEEDSEVYFICPVSDTEVTCRRLYLRADYPLFGCAEFLNVI